MSTPDEGSVHDASATLVTAAAKIMLATTADPALRSALVKAARQDLAPLAGEPGCDDQES